MPCVHQGPQAAPGGSVASERVTRHTAFWYCMHASTTAVASYCVTYSFGVLVQACMQRGRGRSTQLHAFRYFSDIILP